MSKPRPGPGEAPGAGNEQGQHPPNPTTVLGGGDPKIWGCPGIPLTVLSRCRWGEEQLPNGQTQKYWVSVRGEFGGAAAPPSPCGVQLGFGEGGVTTRVPCPLCRRRPTRGARRGARAATFASPAASTSARWRLSWWGFGAASAWRTCPTSEAPRCPRCPHPQRGPARLCGPCVPWPGAACPRCADAAAGCSGPCAGGAPGAAPVSHGIYPLIPPAPGSAGLRWRRGALQRQLHPPTPHPGWRCGIPPSPFPNGWGWEVSPIFLPLPSWPHQLPPAGQPWSCGCGITQRGGPLSPQGWVSPGWGPHRPPQPIPMVLWPCHPSGDSGDKGGLNPVVVPVLVGPQVGSTQQRSPGHPPSPLSTPTQGLYF